MGQPPLNRAHSAEASIWKSILCAVEAEPQSINTLRGASGIAHPVIAIGFDENRQRLIVLSHEAEARSAAMLQADLQAAFGRMKVIVARPILLSIADLAEEFVKEDMKYIITAGIAALVRPLTKLDETGIFDFSTEEWPWMHAAQASCKLAALANLHHQLREKTSTTLSGEYRDELRSQGEDESPLEQEEADFLEMKEQKDNLLKALLEFEPDLVDRTLGICPVPVYKFAMEDLEVLESRRDIDAARDILLRHDVLQYFFPPPDQLALGLIEKGDSPKRAQLLDQVLQAPGLGHPFSDLELLSSECSILELVDALQDKDLIVEGEYGLELTGEGQEIRSSVRFKPKEGLISKLINRFSFTFNLKDLFSGGGN